MCIALATAFAHKNQCFNFPMCQVIFRPFKVMAMTPMRLANFAYKNLYCLQGV